MIELITFEPVGHVTVGTLIVRRPSEFEVDELAAALRAMLSCPDAQLVVLDFSTVAFFEANLPGKLIWLHKQLTARGGRLALCGLGSMASHPTMITFARLMPICPTLDEAIRALCQPPN